MRARPTTQPRRTPARSAAALGARLAERRPQIEAEVMARLQALVGPDDPDPPYAEGLRAAVSAAVGYGLDAVELGEERSPPPPPILLAQARMAARVGISLDTVLRRCFAGHSLLGDFILEEAGKCNLPGAALKRLLRSQATLLDRLLAAVAEEFRREASQRPSSTERRRVQKVQRLLDGEMVDATDLVYGFEQYHLALCVSGPEAKRAIKQIAAPLDRNLLLICPVEDAAEEDAWAWLGGRRTLEPQELLAELPGLPSQLRLSVGEPAEGLAGWRLSHRQALAALAIAKRGPKRAVRYADVALLASVLKDELLVTSLREMYLKPLEAERDGGKVALETLRAYFRAGRNVSSTAAMLGVSRQAVTGRIRAVEETLGCSLASCAAELEAAVRIEG